MESFLFPMHAPYFIGMARHLTCLRDPCGLPKVLGCKNQAFQLKRNVIGLQFHLETTPENASALLDHLHDDLTPGPYVQTEAEIRVVPAAFYQTIHSIMNDVLSYLTLT